ncbi:MAG TPA: cytidine deaminase [Bacteroidales bacterium]|nr:cytidine deaminase [Bacteroidales bacterium]
MRINKIQVNVEEYDTLSEMTENDRELIEGATKSIGSAYAAYSHFRVGAALRLSNGMIITGNNQENAAYPSGMCAERVAMYYAKSQFPDQSIESIAISAHSNDFIIKEAVTPCGACRQVIAEYQTQQEHPIRIIMKSEKGPIRAVNSIEDLLPLLFHVEELKRKK